MDLFLPGKVNIGINTGATGYLLSVDGKIIAEEVRIQLQSAWPDYVFDKHYALKSLNEVEDFILTHHHLPEIPSATEIKADGLLVGEMHNLLLKKIEELTLYLIQQQKTIDALQEEIKDLKIK
jgi:hypothetical protein